MDGINWDDFPSLSVHERKAAYRLSIDVDGLGDTEFFASQRMLPHVLRELTRLGELVSGHVKGVLAQRRKGNDRDVSPEGGIRRVCCGDLGI